MSFDAHAAFANLAEKERLRGHHSSEGRALRILSRALHGWSSGTLSNRDVVALCDQAVEDWLKARMNVSEWSAIGLPALLAMAVETDLLARVEADQLTRVHEMRGRSAEESVASADAEDALRYSIQIVEERWH